MHRTIATTLIVVLISACGGDSESAEPAGPDTTVQQTTPIATAHPTVSPPREPPTTATAPSAASTDRYPAGTVLGILASDGRFDLLLELLETASSNFINFMSWPDWNHTLFAPTDDAFASLPPEVLEALSSPTKVPKTQFLDHLILPIVVRSDAFESGPMETVGAEHAMTPVAISVDADGTTADGARIIAADIEASNGIIHAIDTVIGIDYVLDILAR